MPRGDRTGPQGEGPMTGRQLGYGAGYDNPGYTKGAGRGMGREFFGHGFGRGFFRSRPPVTTLEEQPEISRQSNEMEAIKLEVRDIKKSLSSALELLEKLTLGKRKVKQSWLDF